MRFHIHSLYELIFVALHTCAKPIQEGIALSPEALALKQKKAGDSKQKKIMDCLPQSFDIALLKKFSHLCPIDPNIYKIFFGEELENYDKKLNDFKQTAQEKLLELNEKYGYAFDIDLEHDDLKNYLKCYQMCVLHEVCISDPNGCHESQKEMLGVASKYAFNLFLLCNGNLEIAQTILNVYNNFENPLHEILWFPVLYYKKDNKTLDLQGWRKFLSSTINQKNKKYYQDIIQGFSRAHDLQDPKTGESPCDIFVFLEKDLLSRLPRSNENWFLAKLCKYYIKNDADKKFNVLLDFLKDNQLKTHDKIPSINLDISMECPTVLNSKKLYLLRLPPGDLRGLILGEITDCCLSVCNRSGGEKISEDGNLLEHNGFYILIEAKKSFSLEAIDWENLEDHAKILGAGYLWRAAHPYMDNEPGTTLTFDSWENLHNASLDSIIIRMLQALSKKICTQEKSIQRITIGSGGRTTPSEIKESPKTIALSMFKGTSYPDGRVQVELFVSPELQEERNFLKHHGFDPSVHVCMITHEKIKEILKKIAVLSKKNPTINFNGMDINTVEILISSEMLELYNETSISTQSFKDFNLEQIKILTSFEFLEYYKNHPNISPSIFRGLTYCEIDSFLKNPSMMSLINHKNHIPIKFLEALEKNYRLETLDPKIRQETMQYLTSEKMIRLYYETDIVPENCSPFLLDRLQTITSDDAIAFYNQLNVSPSLFVDCCSEVIETFINPYPMHTFLLCQKPPLILKFKFL